GLQQFQRGPNGLLTFRVEWHGAAASAACAPPFRRRSSTTRCRAGRSRGVRACEPGGHSAPTTRTCVLENSTRHQHELLRRTYSLADAAETQHPAEHIEGLATLARIPQVERLRVDV